MKKILSIIIILLMASVLCYAAGTTTISSDQVFKLQNGSRVRVIKVDFTADASTGAIASVTLAANGSTSGMNNGPLVGWKLSKILIDGNSGTTEVQEDSDMTITSSGYDILGGAGTDMVDNSAERIITPIDSNTVYDGIRIFADAVVAISSTTSVADARGTELFIFEEE